MIKLYCLCLATIAYLQKYHYYGGDLAPCQGAAVEKKMDRLNTISLMISFVFFLKYGYCVVLYPNSPKNNVKYPLLSHY